MELNIRALLSKNFYAISLYTRQITGSLVLFILARYLTVYDYGLFSSYKNIAAFCLMFANMGFAGYILISSQANIRKVQQKIALFLINAILLLLICMAGSYFSPLEAHFLFVLVLIRTFFDGIFFALVLPYFQASRKFNTIGCINVIYGIGVLLIAVISYILKLSLVKFLLLNILLGFINFSQCVYYAKIKLFLALKRIKHYIKFVDRDILTYISVTAIHYIYYQIPSLYVSTKLPKEDAALFFAAFTLSTIMVLLMTAICQKMTPELINNSIENIRKILKKNFIALLGINLLVLSFFAIFGKFILKLFYGQEVYTMAYIPLLILSLSNLGVAAANIYGEYLTTSGNQKFKIPIQIAAIFISAASLLIFHKQGIIGSSLACLISVWFVAVMYTQKALKILNFNENSHLNKTKNQID